MGNRDLLLEAMVLASCCFSAPSTLPTLCIVITVYPSGKPTYPVRLRPARRDPVS
jgi:hypothetical protein